MRKIMFLGLLVVFLPAMVSAQEKIEAPAWNVGDKWEFGDQGTIGVLKMEKEGYVVRFSESTCFIESQGFQTIIFDKTTLQRILSVKGDKRNKYRMGLRKILNFPYTPKKEWTGAYSAGSLFAPAPGAVSFDCYEKYKIIGWEDIGVRGGKFKALKMEAIRGHGGAPSRWVGPVEYKTFYWYSADVKYFVKCEYDPWVVKEYRGKVVNWELTSLQLKK